MKNKVLLIGLDGVDIKLLEYLVSKNITPNIARLYKSGAHGRLSSILPLQTPTTWTSFLTGKNPGKHGIYAFFSYKANSYELKVLNSLERKSATLWHILNNQGRTTGLFNMPSLFPPERIDGYMVCGMLAPSISSSFTHPRALKDELLRNVKDYEIDIGMTMSAKDSKAMLLKKTYQLTEKRIEAAKFLLKGYPCDLTMLIFTETDRIEHFFLKDMETGSEYKKAIEDYFKFLDGKLGEILGRIDKDTAVIVMSDHGMAPFKKVFYVNNLLVKAGFAFEEKGSVGYMRQSLIERSFKFFVDSMVRMKLSPEALKRFIPRRLFNKLTVILGRGGAFDWTKTAAFFSSSIGEGIVVNLKGRQPKGIVPPEEYEKIRDAVIREIKAVRDPDTGQAIAEQVYKREEIFKGDCVNEAPDIMLKLKDGYIPHSSTDASGIIGTENPLEPISADHTPDAMVIISAEGVRKDFCLENAGILDMAPTILRLMRLRAPADLDGKALDEIFEDKNAFMPQTQGMSESEKLRDKIKGLKSSGRIK